MRRASGFAIIVAGAGLAAAPATAQETFDLARCPAETRSPAPSNGRAAGSDALLEKSGQGLWIGGAHFGPGTIAKAVVVTGDTPADSRLRVNLTDAGRDRFRCIQSGRTGQTIELSFDGRFVSRPMLRESIHGHQIEITGGWTRQEAESIAARLQPAPVSSAHPKG